MGENRLQGWNGGSAVAATAPIRVCQRAACAPDAATASALVQLWRGARVASRPDKQGRVAAVVQAACPVGWISQLAVWLLADALPAVDATCGTVTRDVNGVRKTWTKVLMGFSTGELELHAMARVTC